MAEIVRVTYTASDGTAYDLQAAPLRIKEANFHNWSWSAQSLGRLIGEKVLRFGKSAASYQTELYIKGPVEERKTIIDALHTSFERDIRKTQPGKLTWGKYYIKCFIRSSSTYPDNKNLYTVNDIDIFCPYPMWIEPIEYSFYPSEDETPDSRWLDYNYGYAYDYTPKEAGADTIVNDSPGDAAFRAVIYGPVTNPFFYIGTVRYMVNAVVLANEYLVIDTMEKTVMRHLNDGTEINEFNNREKDGTSIFTAIPVGTSDFIWPGTFGVDLTIYKERSEPAWT